MTEKKREGMKKNVLSLADTKYRSISVRDKGLSTSDAEGRELWKGACLYLKGAGMTTGG